MKTNTHPEPSLKREIGVFGVAANVLNISIGSGLFLFPAIVAGLLGTNGIQAYILCGILFMLVILCYMEVSSRIPDTGGGNIYIEKAFGPFWGFLANVVFWFGIGIFAMAALLNALVDMLGTVAPVFQETSMRVLFFFAVTGFLVVTNIRGVKQGMQLVNTLSNIKVLSILVLVIAGFMYSSGAHFSGLMIPDSAALGEAALLLFFAYGGGETALNVSGEMKDPRKTAPRGILIGVAGVILVFCVVHLSAQGVLGPSLADYDKAPLAGMAGQIFGDVGYVALIALAMVAI